MSTVLEFTSPRAGKTALMWHHLVRESQAAGCPITCCTCRRPHAAPPRYGQCPLPCGSYAFEVRTEAAGPQLALALDFHGGEQ